MLFVVVRTAAVLEGTVYKNTLIKDGLYYKLYSMNFIPLKSYHKTLMAAPLIDRPVMQQATIE